MTNIFMVNVDVLFNTKKLFQMFLFSFSSFFFKVKLLFGLLTV